MARNPLNKLKTQILTKVILPNRIDIVSFGTFEGVKTLSKQSLLYSIILDVHPAFLDEVEQLRRDSLHFDHLLPYPKKDQRTLENVFSVLFSVENETKQMLYKLANGLVSKYKLPYYWQNSIEIKIITDIIPVPADWGPILFHTPHQHVDYEVGKKNLKTLGESLFSNPNVNASKKLLDNIGYPGIFIRENIQSKNTLLKWIDKNWDPMIKPFIDKLPEPLFQNIDLERFTTGIYFWKLRRSGASWDDVDREVLRLEQIDSNFFGIDTDRIYPDRTYLQKVVDETEEYLQRFSRF